MVRWSKISEEEIGKERRTVMSPKGSRVDWLWKAGIVVLLPFFLGLIPGVPHPFIHAFLWWTPIPSRADLPPLAEGAERILIVAPHPDDEVLAIGGTIAHLVEEGHTVLVAFLTNGDANRAAKRLLTFNLWHRSTDYRALGYRRQKEAVRALERLGVSSSQLVFLGYPDGGLMALWSDHWKREKPYTSPYTKASYPFYTTILLCPL